MGSAAPLAMQCTKSPHEQRPVTSAPACPPPRQPNRARHGKDINYTDAVAKAPGENAAAGAGVLPTTDTVFRTDPCGSLFFGLDYGSIKRRDHL